MWQCSVSDNQTQCHKAQSVRKSNTMSQCSKCQKLKHNVTVLSQSVRKSDNVTVSNNQTQCHNAQSVRKSNTVSQCSECQKIRQCDSAQWQTIKDNVTMLSVGRTFSIQVQENTDQLIAAHFLPTRHAREVMEACFRYSYPPAATVAGADRSDKRTR